MAQQTLSIDAKVIDGETKQSLPYASIYITDSHGTISNQEGEFVIKALPTDRLRISYVGYETQTIKASEISDVILLKPQAIRLNEVVVKPINLHAFLMQALAKYKKESKANKKTVNSFFYRQITKTNSVCNEIVESFFNATPHLSILNLELITGRYAVLLDDSINKYAHFKNFFYLSQLRPLMLSGRVRDKENWLIQPLFENYAKYYTVSYDALYNSDNASTTYKINFKPRKGISNPIITGSMFIDSSTLELKRFEGEIVNNILTFTDETGHKEQSRDSTPHFVINYKTVGGVSMVESVIVDIQYTIKYGNVDIHSVMYNIGLETKNKTKKMAKSNDLLNKIANQNYDPDFWKDKAIIKRTPLEQSTIEMFEKKNLFGTYSLDK
ncbi:carboxypeptidase-like regulatory domain-containing protein [Prevotella heparinolytica]|nr:carboxypeptidase-like regulatory domain-containing protein [Bacteroides heparinolyticus]